MCNDFSCTIGNLGGRGVEKIPGPGVGAEKILQILCSECDRNLDYVMGDVYDLVNTAKKLSFQHPE